ncbi:MAG: DUF3883 domain-containing protein [Xanthomonadales bacterium]|nr:DUF3883 domain-containing protein [Xanthomonadales bacterium]
MRQGALLLDPQDPGQQPRLLLLVDHQIRDGSGQAQRVISRRLQFVSLRADGAQQFAGWAPHLDLQPLPSELHPRAEPLLAQDWLDAGLEQRAIAFASQQLVPEHYQEVRERRLAQIDKVHAAVRDRLIKEINHLQHRAEQLRLDVQAGRQPRVQPENLQRRAEELVARLQQREAELSDQRQIESATPVVVGAALVIPNGLARQWRGEPGLFSQDAAARIRVEAIAMQAVMEAETALGYVPRDVSADKCGWDITSQPPMLDGRLPDARLIEVKGRAKGADTITLTKNECFVAFNQSDKYWLAVVLVGEDDSVDGPYYIRQPVTQAPDWAEISKDLELRELLRRAERQDL